MHDTTTYLLTATRENYSESVAWVVGAFVLRPNAESWIEHLEVLLDACGDNMRDEGRLAMLTGFEWGLWPELRKDINAPEVEIDWMTAADVLDCRLSIVEVPLR